MELHELRLVFITIDTVEAGRALAQHLVTNHLAACVNIIPAIESVYVWEGSLHQDSEVLLIAKTTAQVFPQLEAAVRSTHPYTTPEILAFPVSQAFQGYADWVISSVTPPSGDTHTLSATDPSGQ